MVLATPKRMTAEETLSDILRNGIPLTGFMGVTIHHCDAEHLCLAAPYDPNRNHKGAAFGGSLAALAVVTGWSVVELACRERGLDAEVVIGRLDVNYLAPITRMMMSHCVRPDTETLKPFVDDFMIRGKAVMDLEIIIEGERSPYSVMSRARYVALRRKSERDAKN